MDSVSIVIFIVSFINFLQFQLLFLSTLSIVALASLGRSIYGMHRKGSFQGANAETKTDQQIRQLRFHPSGVIRD